MLPWIVLFLSVLIICSGFLAIVQKKVSNSIIFILFVFLGTAGIFFCLSAEFIGVVQIIVYAGALLVVFVFAVIVVGKKPEYEKSRLLFQKSFSVILVLFFLTIIWSLISGLASLQHGSELLKYSPSVDIQILSVKLLQEYIIPFETASILLLAGIVGAIYLAKPPAAAGITEMNADYSNSNLKNINVKNSDAAERESDKETS